MTSLNRPARLNRALLSGAGALLLAAGAFALATHADRLHLVDPDARLVPGTDTPPTWVLAAVAAAAVILGLLSLRWLLAQTQRRPKTRTWQLETDPATGRTDLPADTAVEPLTAEIAEYPGVHAAHATLAGTQQRPTLALRITAASDADLTEIRQRLDGHALPRLRQALDLNELPARVEFRFVSRTGAQRVH